MAIKPHSPSILSASRPDGFRVDTLAHSACHSGALMRRLMADEWMEQLPIISQ